MQSAHDIAAKHGIGLKRFTQGNQKTLCPKCSHTRKKKRDPCLSVTIDGEGLVFKCHNCGHAGGEKYDSDERGGSQVVWNAGNRSRDSGHGGRTYWRRW